MPLTSAFVSIDAMLGTSSASRNSDTGKRQPLVLQELLTMLCGDVKSTSGTRTNIEVYKTW